MTQASPEFEIVEIPDPGRGHILAEKAATLLLQGIQDVRTPTREQVLRTVATEIDGTFSLAAVDSKGSVVGTGGLLLIETDEPRRAAIVNMAVMPSERGRGLGAKIMSRLEEEASRLNAKELFGQPEPDSVGFYEKHGCQQSRRAYIDGAILTKLL